ncbi:MAG: tetratricopeptide repeat protein, partial [Planctomycetota bacterium]|nr:tetratricopeptide repeat protein [Planctomycetota bacterium]
CRLRLVAYHLSRGDQLAAAKNVSALLALGPSTVAKAVQRACLWPVEHRRWLAEAILPLTDEMPLRRPAAPAEADIAQRLEWVLRLDPEQREALVMSAEIHYRHGNHRRAAADLERALALVAAIDGGSYWEYYYLGQIMCALDRYAEAEKYFRAAARMIPRLPDPWYGLIDALERQAKYRDAIAVACRILLLERTADFEARMQALLRRGRLFGWLGRKDLALRDIEAAMAFWPGKADEPQALLIKARALVLSDLVAEALPLLERLIAADPGCAEYHLLRAQACQDAGLTSEAAAAYRQAMACGAQTATVLNNFAWALLVDDDPAHRDPALALALARRAVAIDSGKNAYSLDTLAEACYQNRLFDEAVVYEQQALERGGEIYRPSLERYRQAALAAKAGQEVKIEVSHLKEHHKPPRGDGGSTLDLSAMPAPPRFPLAGYQQAARSASSADEMFASLAGVWRKFPAAAIDDPRVDLRTILT